MALFSSNSSNPPKPSTHSEFSSQHLAKLPKTAKHLLMPRPFVTPVELTFDPAANELLVDTGVDRVTLTPTSGEPDWLVAAHHIGGLLIRVAPTAEPHKLSLFASWEGQLHVVVGEVL